jgi:hypothetical protein
LPHIRRKNLNRKSAKVAKANPMNGTGREQNEVLEGQMFAEECRPNFAKIALT